MKITLMEAVMAHLAAEWGEDEHRNERNLPPCGRESDMEVVRTI